MNDHCKTTPEGAAKEEPFFQQLMSDTIKGNIRDTVLGNLSLLTDGEILKEVYRRGLDVGYQIGSLEDVSTTKLKSELRRRKK